MIDFAGHNPDLLKELLSQQWSQEYHQKNTIFKNFEDQLKDGFSQEFIDNYRKIFYLDPKQMCYDLNLQSMLNRYNFK